MATLPEVFPAKEAEREHSNRLLNSLKSMRENGELADVTLVCEGGHESRAHRIVLSASSDYFRNEDAVTRMTDRYIFDSIRKEDMMVVIDFMYTGKITAEDEIKTEMDRLKTLLQAANGLKVQVLVQWCLQRLAQAVDTDNYQDMFLLAEECHNPGLTSRIVTFVAQNFTYLVSTKQIVDLELGLMKRVLVHPEMVEIPTDDIIRSLFRWVETDPDRKKLLADLIQPLDLSYLSKDYLCTLMGSSLIKNDRDVLAILVGESTRRSMNPACTEVVRRGRQIVCFGKSEQKRIMRLYDINSNEWLPPKTPPFNFDVGMASVGYGRYIYIFGGGGWPPNPSPVIIEYCPTTNIASDCEGCLGAPVCRAGAFVCDDAIYIVNGLNKDKKRTNTVQCFNPSDGSTQTVAATNESHFCPHGFTFNNCLYILGAFNDDEKSVERYDPLCDHWTIVTRIPGSIEWCRAALCGEKLYVARKRDEAQLQVFDLTKAEWEIKEFQRQAPPSNDWGLWSCKKHDKSVLCARYADNVLYFFNPESGQWGEKSEANKNAWQYQLTCFVWS